MQAVCTPVFVERITHEFYSAGLEGHAAGGGPWTSGNPWIWIEAKKAAYQKNMVDLVNRNPKLLELLMKRNAAAQRYDEVRKKKFKGGRIFVWD